ncbi:SPFH domain-containing protein [Bacillus luti]|nr:peptidase [Bacillus cereus]
MTIGQLGLIIGFLFVLTLGLSSIRIVQQSNALIVERLGKFNRELKGGIHILIPFLDVVRHRVDLRTQVLDIPAQPVISKDNATVHIDAVVYFRITDAFNAVYEIQNLPLALRNITATTLRNAVGSMELDETLSSRDSINTTLQIALDEATDRWGVKVERIEVKEVAPERSLAESMSRQMMAERTKREQVLLAQAEKESAILKAQGHREAVILQAEAEKQSKILEAEAEKESRMRLAEGEAEAIRQVAAATKDQYDIVFGALKDAGMDEQMLTYESIQAFKELAKSNNKVFVPMESKALLGNIGAIQELLQTPKV